MYMYLYIYMYMYMYIHVHVYILHAHAYQHTYIHTYMYMHTYNKYIHVHVYLYIHTYMYIHKCTLHCTCIILVDIFISQVNLPDGVFNSWAYMTCLECVESMMVLVDTEVLANTPSAILILIRAELWHYAWEKVR